MPLTPMPPDPAAAPAPDTRRPLEIGLLLGIALALVVAHTMVNLFSPYEFHRDEFLYLAMGRHLRLWAMDFPPMIALLARATVRLLGDSMVAIRTVPALTHGLLIFLAGVAAREFGGRRFAQALAALSVALAPVFLRPGNLYMPVILDQLWWTLALLMLARIGRTAQASGGVGDPIAWLGLGIVGGLGLLTKFSIGFIGVSMLVGLLLSPQRRVFLTRWPWGAALLALVIGSPSIVGQIRLGFPVIGQMRDLQAGQLVHVSYLEFVSSQVMFLGPIMLLPILAVLRMLTLPAERGHRVVAWSCLAAFALLLLLHGKAYYIAPIYPVLIGAGAAALELGNRVLAEHAVGRVLVRGAVTALILIFGAFALPMGLPILKPAAMARYAASSGITEATRTNWGSQLPLPQDYADMLGWKADVDSVARVFNSLPPAERAEAVVGADSYGHAGAIDYYGPKLGLPPAISAVGSYWFFGPGTKPGNVGVVLGDDSASLARLFRSVHQVTRTSNPWGVPYERHVPIFVVRQPWRPLQQVWPSLAGQN